MRTLPNRWLALACLAIALTWISACSDDDTTCPAPRVCPDPGKALPGTWVIFESFLAGDPDESFVGGMVGFLPHDSLFIVVPSMGGGNFRWVANDSTILLTSTTGSSILLFRYEFDADTLIMDEKTNFFDCYWRLSRLQTR